MRRYDQKPLTGRLVFLIAVLATLVITTSAHAFTSNYCGVQKSSGSPCDDTSGTHSWTKNGAFHLQAPVQSLCQGMVNVNTGALRTGYFCYPNTTFAVGTYPATTPVWRAFVRFYSTFSPATIYGTAQT